MRRLLENYKNASREIKFFIWTIISIGIILMITTVYAYMRLDTQRSGTRTENVNS